MGMRDDCVDPFGAPEFWVDGSEREIVCPGVIRFTVYAREDGEKIVKVKLLVSITNVMREQSLTDDFISAHAAEKVARLLLT